MRLFKGKNNLDEMQEQELLHIEKKGFWSLYFLLAAAVIVETSMGFTLRELAGEAVCFIFASIYVMTACLRKGIWDRRLKADGKTNLLVSLTGGTVAGLVVMMTVLLRFPVKDHLLGQAAATFFIVFLMTFFVCMALLTVCTAVFKRRVKKLEDRAEEE